MKTTLLFSLLLLTKASCLFSTTVYVCNSKNGKKYHFVSNCRGLNVCQSQIRKITLEDAQKQGKTRCKLEK